MDLSFLQSNYKHTQTLHNLTSAYLCKLISQFLTSYQVYSNIAALATFSSINTSYDTMLQSFRSCITYAWDAFSPTSNHPHRLQVE